MKISFGVGISAFLGAGGKVSVSFSFDTENLELGAKVSGGFGAGIGGSVAVTGSISESGEGPARNSGNLSASVEGTASAGPLTGTLKLAEFDEGQTTTIADDVSGSGGIRQRASLGLPSLKGGLTANVTLTGHAEGTSSVIPDTIDAVKSGVEKLKQLYHETMVPEEARE